MGNYNPGGGVLGGAGGTPSKTSQHQHQHQQKHQHHHHHHHHHQQHQQTSQHSQIPLTKSKLPTGFTKKQTSQGQVFFVDSHGQKYWYDPSVPRELLNASLNLDKLVGKLSATWETKQTPSGKIYYVNHIKKTTQFTDPRLVAYREYLMSILSPQQLLNNNDNNNSHSNSSHQQQNVHQVPSDRDLSLSRRLVAQRRIIKTPQQLPYPPLLNRLTANANDLPESPIMLYNPPTSAAAAAPPTNHQSPSSGLNNSSLDIYGLSMQQQQQQQYQQPINRSDLCVDYSSSPNSKNQFNQKITNASIVNKLLADKISLLRQELVKRQVVTHSCKIDIRRRKIFEDSFRIISQMSSRDLKKRLNVRFRGEEGVDFGGVAREWFYLLSRDMLNPAHGLFQYTSSDIYNLQINPDSGIVYSEHLSYMHFCGRIIGMAVFHGHFTESHFTLPFYKMLLRKPITLQDIEFVDPELYRSLCWILEHDITDQLETTFLVHHNAFGQLQEHELKEGGKDIAVTEKNKHEYVSLYVNYRCRCGIEKQSEALQRGFDELIEPSLLAQFNEQELELLIGGLSKINVDDWKSNTKLKNCNSETSLVKWFWDIVKTRYNEDKRSQLLQFVTGSPRVPIQGFKALRGVEAELRPFTIHLIRNGNTNDLPKSHTCFNRLDLPPYETYDKLRDKLTQAIEETMGFAMQ